MAHPGKVWLPEHCLHLIRHAFRALLTHFEVPPEDWPKIKEEPKPVWPSKLETRLLELEDRERRALDRLAYLSQAGLLTNEKLRVALDLLDGLADDLAVTQRQLEQQIVRLARGNGYGEEYWGTRL